MKNQCKPIALWAVPRSVSSAFERVFMERGDFKVFHEPFAGTYYFSLERLSDRYLENFLQRKKPREDYSHDRVLRDILSVEDKPVFLKDLAFHTSAFMSPVFASNFTNTFIVREPRSTLASLHKMLPDFTFEEAGYEALHRLYSCVVEDGQEAVIVDAEDLSQNPKGTVEAYCNRLGVPFLPHSLSWESRKIPEWKTWDVWHERAQQSTEVGKISSETELPEELEEVYERCLPYYEELRSERLCPKNAFEGQGYLEVGDEQAVIGKTQQHEEDERKAMFERLDSYDPDGPRVDKEKSKLECELELAKEIEMRRRGLGA